MKSAGTKRPLYKLIKNKPQPPAKPGAVEGDDTSLIVFWVICALIFVGLVVLIIFLVSYPYPHSDYYRDAKLLKYDASGRVNCTVGEQYDPEVEICAPLSPTPLPIVDELKSSTAKPCDSFYNYVSGKWIESHKNENRAFTYAYRRNQRFIHDIIRDPTSGPVYTFYRSCLDTIVYQKHTFLDRSQLRHVREHVLGALKSHGDLPIVFARLVKYGFTAPFMFTIEPHPTSSQMVPLIRWDPRLLPPPQAGVTEGVPTTVGELPIPPTQVYDLLECLRKLHEWHVDKDFPGDSFVDYVRSDYFKRDMTSMAVLLDGSPHMFWEQFLRELNGYQMEKEIHPRNQSVWVLDRLYVQSVLHGLEQISLKEWRAFVEFSITYHTHEFVPDLPGESYVHVHNPIKREARFPHHMLRDVDANERSCLTVTHKLFPAIIGNIYIERHVKDYTNIKRQITEIVENIRVAFVDMVQNTTWLSQPSKDKMINKLNAIIVRVIHPNYYEEEPFARRMTIDNYLRNLNIIRRYISTRSLELWTKGVPNRDEIQRFGSPISTVNAFYSPVTNTVTVFAGILTRPFYSPQYGAIGLYAGIGMIIAHELGGHGMDRDSRLFDRHGLVSLVDPWTREEQEVFKTRVKALMDEYKAPFGCENEDYGAQTIREDMADLSGVRAAYLALTRVQGRPLSRVEARQFFEVFGQMWAETYDKAFYCDRVAHDEHAVSAFRVDLTLRQLKEFAWAFGCKQGEGMVNENPVEIYGGG